LDVYLKRRIIKGRADLNFSIVYPMINAAVVRKINGGVKSLNDLKKILKCVLNFIVYSR